MLGQLGIRTGLIVSSLGIWAASSNMRKSKGVNNKMDVGCFTLRIQVFCLLSRPTGKCKKSNNRVYVCSNVLLRQSSVRCEKHPLCFILLNSFLRSLPKLFSCCLRNPSSYAFSFFIFRKVKMVDFSFRIKQLIDGDTFKKINTFLIKRLKVPVVCMSLI